MLEIEIFEISLCTNDLIIKNINTCSRIVITWLGYVTDGLYQSSFISNRESYEIILKVILETVMKLITVFANE